jgi:hypothetical protein
MRVALESGLQARAVFSIFSYIMLHRFASGWLDGCGALHSAGRSMPVVGAMRRFGS